MNLKQSISPKYLTVIGLILWIPFSVMEGIIADAISLLGFLMFLIGIVGLISAWYKKKKEKTVNTGENPQSKNTFLKAFAIIIVLFIVFSVFYYLGSEEQRKEESLEETISEQKEKIIEYITGKEWRDYNSVSGKFKVRLPAYPEHEIEETTIPIYDTEVKVKFDLYAADKDDWTYYMVGVAKYQYDPELDIESVDDEVFLEAGLQGGLLSAEGNELISSDYTTFREYKALDFWIKNEGMAEGYTLYLKGIFFLVDKTTLYELIVSSDDKHFNEEDYSYFINSFQLTK